MPSSWSSDVSTLWGLLALLANIWLTWKKCSSEKHSSLLTKKKALTALNFILQKDKKLLNYLLIADIFTTLYFLHY